MTPKRQRWVTEHARRVAGAIGDQARRVATPVVRNYGFPYVAPSVPSGVEVPEEPSTLGADYDTSWAREPWARTVRSAITAGPLRAAVDVIARPEIDGVDRLDVLTNGDETQTAIFTPNHHSHIDTGLMIRAIPARLRRHLVVAAAADYFFDQRWKAALSALALNAIPVDRESTGRKSSDALRDLIEDGNSVLIYPEGGRSPDGWGQPFKGGAAYLSIRTGVPVVPVFIDGTGAIYGKGAKKITPGRTRVVFGRPLWAEVDESTRRFNDRIHAAVTRLGDEALTDYWTAARRAGDGSSPALTGPEHVGWRRQWELTDHRKRGISGRSRRRAWPDLDR